MAVELFRLQEGWPLVFHCEQLRANLSPRSCATNFTRNLNLSCAQCRTGAAHAADAPHQVETGEPNNHREANGYVLRFRRVVGQQVCIRCNAQVMRRIEPGLCVSCLNRQAELQRGRNSKGTFPGCTAKRLFKCHALLAGEFPYLKNMIRAKSQCAPVVQRVSGGAFVSGIFTGREEFDRWLAEHYPDAELLDFEQGRSFSELAAEIQPREAAELAA